MSTRIASVPRSACTCRAHSPHHLRRLLEGKPDPEQLTFFQRHPLIRDPAEYGALVAAAVSRPELPTAAPAGFLRPYGATVDNSSSPANKGANTTQQEQA